MTARAMSAIDVLVSEVGPRDGLQNTRAFMPTTAKQAWISSLAAAGLREVEVCSFVPSKLIPQFVDAVDVARHALSIPGLAVAALVPNLKGAERAATAGVTRLSLPISASEAHSRSNVRKTRAEQIAELKRICAFRDAQPPAQRLSICAGISTAFGCTIQGIVPEREVIDLAVQAVAAGADEVSLADTVGYATPPQVRRVFAAVRTEIGDKLVAAHLHNTRGLGLANAIAALEAGIRTLDASLAGLGGCPYAPGASGNIVTEDLVFMLEGMGLRTGIDMGKLLAARRVLEAALPGAEMHGHIAMAGLPKGFERAA